MDRKLTAEQAKHVVVGAMTTRCSHKGSLIQLFVAACQRGGGQRERNGLWRKSGSRCCFNDLQLTPHRLDGVVLADQEMWWFGRSVVIYYWCWWRQEYKSFWGNSCTGNCHQLPPTPMYTNDVSSLLMITHMLWHHYFMQLPLPSHSPLALMTSDANPKVLIVVQVSIDVSLVLSKLRLPLQSPKMTLEMTTPMYWTRWNMKDEKI
eukprot:scaffold86591_cov83-Cyclotella_meneghiniana.AAC.4